MMTVAVHERWSGQAARAVRAAPVHRARAGASPASASCAAATSRAGGSTSIPHPLRVGLVGAGAIAGAPSRRARASSRDVVLAAVCDLDDAAAEPSARRGPRAPTRDWEAMLAASRSTRCSCARRRCITRRRWSPRSPRACPCTSRSRSRARWRTAEAIVAAWQRAAPSAPSATSGARSTCSTELQALRRVTGRAMLVSRSSGRPNSPGATSTAGPWFMDPRHERRPILFELASHHIDLQIAHRRRGRVGAGDRRQRPPRPRRPAATASRRRRLAALRFAGGGLGAVHLVWSARPRRSTRSTSSPSTWRSTWPSTRLRTAGAPRSDVAIKGEIPPASPRSRSSGRRRSGDRRVPCAPADAENAGACCARSQRARVPQHEAGAKR